MENEEREEITDVLIGTADTFVKYYEAVFGIEEAENRILDAVEKNEILHDVVRREGKTILPVKGNPGNVKAILTEHFDCLTPEKLMKMKGENE